MLGHFSTLSAWLGIHQVDALAWRGVADGRRRRTIFGLGDGVTRGTYTLSGGRAATLTSSTASAFLSFCAAPGLLAMTGFDPDILSLDGRGEMVRRAHHTVMACLMGSRVLFERFEDRREGQEQP